MKEIRILMGMPITVEIGDGSGPKALLNSVFDYFKYIDEKFSTYKEESEITRINKKSVNKNEYSDDMREVLRLSEETKIATNGYFDIFHEGKYDPSGLVKGWAIHNAAEILKQSGAKIFFIDAGGDIEAAGKYWSVGIRNPFNLKEIVKIVYIKDKGIATSGVYERGEHIYNPTDQKLTKSEISSLTVIGPNIYEADRFATAAFAMGKNGIHFIESLNGFEGYMIDKNGIATFTGEFNEYTKKHA